MRMDFSPIKTAIAAAGLMVLAALLEGRSASGTPIRYAAAGLQMLASAVVILALIRSVRLIDDLHARLHLEAMSLAFAATFMLTAGYSFVHQAGLPSFLGWEHVWPLMAVLWALGYFAVRRRYE